MKRNAERFKDKKVYLFGTFGWGTGMYMGHWIKEVEELAKLPSREQLLSMLLNSMLGPIRKLAYATVAIADKKEGSAE